MTVVRLVAEKTYITRCGTCVCLAGSVLPLTALLIVAIDKMIMVMILCPKQPSVFENLSFPIVVINYSLETEA